MCIRDRTLPVLQSKSDSFDFMESLLGGPTSRPETFTYGNIGEDANTKIKQVFPASPNDRDFLTLNRLPLPRKFESKTTPTSDLSRMTSPDVSTFDKKEQYKTDRLEMDNTFDERFLDTGARELGSARRSNRPSDVEMTQRQGRTKFELEQKQLDLERGRKITGKDKVPDFTENLPDNVETLIQGSIAQGKRRAGAAKKKRGRR